MNFWKIFSRQKPAQHDLENAGAARSESAFPGSDSLPQGCKPLSPNDDKLAEFRLLTGITTAPSMLPASSFRFLFGGRPAANVGIYPRVVRNEQNTKKGYKNTAYLINSCLGLQIIVAAALTAMGAANSAHGAITALGAINTVIAGVLTFLKGSGLPNRFKYYEGEWKKLREFIEQREREFTRPSCQHDVHKIVAAIEKMYDEVKTDIAANTPDAYVSVGHVGNRARPGEEMSGHQISKDFTFAKNPLKDERQVERMASEKMTDASKAATEKVGRFSSLASEKFGNLSSGLEEKAEEVQGLAGRAEKLASGVKEDTDDAVRHGEEVVDKVKKAEADLR